MSQWAVTEFVSRVAQLVDRHPVEAADELAYERLAALFPVAEPSPEFVAALYRRLMESPPASDIFFEFGPDRRVVYGVAAGSLASAAVVALIVLRYRAAHRAAA